MDQVEDNLIEMRSFRVKLELANVGSMPIAGWHDWAIYFYTFTMPEQVSVL